MLLWKDIIKYHQNPPQTSIFSRLPETQLKYDNHRKSCGPIKDHILNKYLYNRLKWNIVDNKFPYHLQENIKHKVLWIYPSIKLNKDKVDTIIKQYTLSHKYNNYIYFQNIGDLRSIPEVPHYHIFIHANDKKLISEH